MVKKLITRKRFLTTAITGLAGITLINKPLKAGSINNSIYRKVGNTGISVTPVCFGAPRTNEESLLRYALDKGINFIDTGRSYGNGNNERLVGRAIAGIREKIVIQSKIRLDEEELPSRGKGTKGAEEIRRALNSKLEESLRALNTSYIDILLYHDALNENLLFHPETIKFFSGMKESGIIKAHGFSTHNDHMSLPARNNSEKIYDVIMIPFNHKGSFVHSVNGRYSEWDQEKLIAILEEAKEKGIGVVAMKTCSGGPCSPSPGAKPTFTDAVRWVLNKDYISSAAIAMANFEEVDQHSILLTAI